MITEQLRTIGINLSSTVIIHSSFSRLSKSLSAQQTCETLTNILAEGTLLMPTMSWKTVTPEQPVFNVSETLSHTGFLTEYFRTTIAEKRSLHPTHSVAGWGANCPQLLSTHQNSITPCDMESPYGKLMSDVMAFDPWIFLLDVGFESCTLIHHYEEVIARNLYVSQKPQQYITIDEKSMKKTCQIYPHNRAMRDFHQYGFDLQQLRKLHQYKWYDANIFIFRAKDLANLVQQRLTNKPDANLVSQAYMRSYVGNF